MTTITATKDLYNFGQCFTKGKEYTVNKDVTEKHQLMNCQTTNDQNQPHIIGVWYKYFTIN